MRLYLLETNKIYKFNLPIKIDGSFLFSYKDSKSKTENILNVEEFNGSWKLKSNGNVNIFLNGNIMPDMVLQDYSCVALRIGSGEEDKFLFSLPSNDKNVSKYEIGTTTTLSIGSSPECNIIYTNNIKYFFSNNSSLIQKKNVHLCFQTRAQKGLFVCTIICLSITIAKYPYTIVAYQMYENTFNSNDKIGKLRCEFLVQVKVRSKYYISKNI
mgnify:CR=1 FL=1